MARTVDRHLDDAHRLVRELGQAGIDLERVGAQLQNEGVDLFVEAFDGAVGDRRREARADARRRRELTWTSGCCRPGSTRPWPGASRRWTPTGTAERLWEADPTLWKPEDEAHQKIIGNALGWLSVFEGVREQVEGVAEFVDELRAEGYRSAVLLGMGGSSLAPEVMREVLGRARGLPRPARARLDRPGGGARRGGRRGPRDDALRRLEQVRRHHGDGELPRLLLRAPPGAGRAPRRPPLRGHHRRGHVAPAGGARPGLPRRVRQPLGHRRPLLGAELLRHGAGGAHRRRPRAAARRRPRRGHRVRPGRPGRREPRRCASAPCWARPRSPAATS